MASPPSRTDLAGTPSVAAYKLAIGALYDYVASLLGNGTATIANDTEKKLARESLGIGQFGFKNHLINGAFLVDQRSDGGASTITAGAAIKYTIDRWYAACTGANITVQQIAGIALQPRSARLTGASGCTATLYGQRIEAANSADLKNQNVAVSLFIGSSNARVVTWSAYYANSVDDFSAKTLISSGTINATTTVDFFSFVFSAGANAGAGVAIEFSTGALGVGETIIYDQVQLEKSNVATEFQSISVQNNLTACQRYYEIGSFYMNGYSNYGTSLDQTFAVTKRTTPTMTIRAVDYYGQGATNALCVAYNNTQFRGGADWGATPTYRTVSMLWAASAEL